MTYLPQGMSVFIDLNVCQLSKAGVGLTSRHRMFCFLCMDHVSGLVGIN